MGQRYPNPRLVKIHRNYTVEEAATVCGKHKNTIRAWIKAGLPTCDNQRPTLILGKDLRLHIEELRKKHKSPLQPGQMYCVKCRSARIPDGSYAALEAHIGGTGSLSGLCPVCDTVIYRRVSLKKWRSASGMLEVSASNAVEEIVNGNDPSLNCDFRTES